MAIALLALASPLGRSQPSSPTRVQIPSLERAVDGSRVSLGAELFEPAAPAPAGGYPAIVALHGCDGLYGSSPGRGNALSRRHADWAMHWVAQGYVVLLPDSLRPRGFTSICMLRRGERTVRPSQRRLDALGALEWIAAREGIARDRIALVGWSHGGSTLLATIDGSDHFVAAMLGRGDSFFRAAVALYPGCRAKLAAGAQARFATPLQIHIGEADDWTPPEPCVELGRQHAARGEDVVVYTYPESHHGFDAPGGALRHLANVTTGAHPASGVHVGPNEMARAEARMRMDAFLATHLSR